MAYTTDAGSSAPAPWYVNYPAPKKEAAIVSREDVLRMLCDARNSASKDFILVDLRRNDHEGGTIRGSVNLPAQSLWPTIPTLYEIFKAAGLRRIIWYCGSSRGRGNRAGSWFADHIGSKGDSNMESLVLLEGIKGWATAGGEYLRWMDEYDERVWRATDK
ncbi:Rhodanese-like domain-containing protein [Diaporthe sp. PMI_573]|nr:Rhodanese-like domain-containing protein [Diaporthaceae sp. PMI_573]